jgi:hypothetical protein
LVKPLDKNMCGCIMVFNMVYGSAIVFRILINRLKTPVAIPKRQVRFKNKYTCEGG